MRLEYDILTASDRHLLQRYAERMMPHTDQIAAEWAEKWLEVLPAQPGVDAHAYRQIVEFLTRQGAGSVFRFLAKGDFDGLYEFQYRNNREGAARQLGPGAVLVFNQHELHRVGRAGQPVIARWIQRLFGDDPLLCAAVQLAQEKLGGQLSTILSEAYSDEREGHLRALGERLQRSLEVSERLRQVGQAITESLELEPVLDLALNTAVQLLQADSAGLTLVDESGSKHQLVRLAGRDFDYPHEMQPIEGSLSGWVYQNNEPVRSGRRTPTLSAHAAEVIARMGIEAFLVVPLRARGRPIGTLGVNRQRQENFSGDDEGILQRLADPLAIAIENARAYGAMRNALDSAERANKAKSEFVAAVSHEIRSPLSAVLGYIELLSDETFGPINAEQREIFGRLDVITHSTLRMTNDLLDQSRLESGCLPVQVGVIEIAPVLDELCETARLAIGERPISFAVQVPPSVTQVQADADRLRQILVNLVTNAVKFTTEGSIAVDVVPENGMVAFRVRDTGRGIHPNDLPRIFELFYRASPNKGGGAGVGLFLSRQLAQAMGGELSAQSEPGKGAVFTLKLPSA